MTGIKTRSDFQFDCQPIAPTLFHEKYHNYCATLVFTYQMYEKAPKKLKD